MKVVYMSWNDWYKQMKSKATPQQLQQLKEWERDSHSEIEAAFAVFGWACPSFQNIWKTRPKGSPQIEQNDATVFLIQWITGHPCDGSEKVDIPKGSLVFKTIRAAMADGMKAGHITYLSSTKSEELVATNAIREALRKDKRLSGEEKYVIKKSRMGRSKTKMRFSI
jgi:hypothetical protein